MVSDTEWAKKLHAYERYSSKIKLLLGGTPTKSYVLCKVCEDTRRIVVTKIEFNEHHKVEKKLKYINESGKVDILQMLVDEYYLEIPSFVDDFEVQLQSELPKSVKYLKLKQIGYPFKVKKYDDLQSCQGVQDFFGTENSLEGIDLQEFDLSGAVKLDYMFYDCIALKYVLFKPQTLNKVKSISYAFKDCQSLMSVNIDDLKIPNVESIDGLFTRCDSIKQINLDFLCKGKKLKSAYKMFSEQGICHADLSCIQLEKDSSPIDMSCAFYNCISLEEVKIDRNKGCNIPVVNLTDIFDDCVQLHKVELSGLDMQKVSQIQGMFNRCRQLKSVEISNQQFRSLTIFTYNFEYCTCLEQIKILNCYFPCLVQVAYNFRNSSVKHIDLTGSKINSAGLRYLQADAIVERLNSENGISLGQDSEVVCVDEPNLVDYTKITIWIRNGRYGQLHTLKLKKFKSGLSIVEV